MDITFPSPDELMGHPELAVLRILKTTLLVAQGALSAVHRDTSEHSMGADEAFAIAIFHQIDTLESLVNEYVESVGRQNEWQHREASEKDRPF